jgi:hypothetical protein
VVLPHHHQLVVQEYVEVASPSGPAWAAQGAQPRRHPVAAPVAMEMASPGILQARRLPLLRQQAAAR